MVMSENNWADYNSSGNWKRSENAVSNPINVQNPLVTQSAEIISPGSLVLSTVDQVLCSSPNSGIKNSTMQRHERKRSPAKNIIDDRSNVVSHGSAQSTEQPIPGAISISQPFEIPTPLGTTPDMTMPLPFISPFMYQDSNRFNGPNSGYGVGSWGAVYGYPEYGATPPTSIFASTPPMPYQLSQAPYVPSPLTNFNSLSLSGSQGRTRRDSFNTNIPPPPVVRNVTAYTAPTPIPSAPTSQQYFLVSPPGSFGSSPTIFYGFPNMASAPPQAPIAPPSNVPVYTPQNGPRTVFTNQTTPIHSYASNGTVPNTNVAHNNRRGQQSQQHSRVTAANSSSSEKSSNIPHRSQQLDDFRNSRLPHLQLSDLGPNVVEFAKDQHGSRFIQQKLERTSNKEKQMVFDEVVKHGQILMTDVFGNYVIQKFFEFGTPEQKNQLVDAIRGNVMNLALQMYGCRVIQKALESISPEQQMDLLTEMKGQVLKCVKDQNGNHVVQKVIERVDPLKLQFIIDSFTSSSNDTVSSLAKHPYGCRVIQRVLEHCTFEQKQIVLEELHKNIRDLISDQYGNYVIQHVIEHGSVEDRDRIVNEIRGDVLKHAQHKFASNVIEKCLTYGNLDQKSILITEVCGDGTRPTQLMDMMKDPFANYVVQKMLDVADSNLRKKMLVSMKPYISQLRRASYGKHIIAKLEKYFQKSAVAPGQSFADFTGTGAMNSQVNSGIFSGIDYSSVNQHSSLFP